MSASNESPGIQPEDDIKMTIWEHLSELRGRLVRAALVVFVTTIGCWVYREKLLAWLLRPYESAWLERKLQGAPELLTLSPTDVITGYMQLSIVGGIVLSVPVIFYQLWAFISPGLYSREKRFIVPFVLFSTTLFVSGVAFAYYVAFPLFFNYAFSLLGQVSSAGTVLTQRPTLHNYLDFMTTMLLGMGGIFELPLFISFLAIAGLVTPKQLIKFSRWAVVGAFVVGAVVTPGTDVTSQVVVSVALIGLYLLSIALAFVVARPRKESTGAP